MRLINRSIGEVWGRWKYQIAGSLSLLVLGAGLIPLIEPAVQNGDSAVYNQQVDDRDWGVRSTHFGYIVLGAIFRALLPGSTDWVMNVMTLVVGVLGLIAVYLAALGLVRSVISSLVAALIPLAVPVYMKGMLLSEVDVPLAAFIAIAFAFWVYSHALGAGVAFGFAMLLSPLASLSLPAFLLTAELRNTGRLNLRTQVRQVALFGLASAAVYVPVVIYHFQDYWHGGRGILHAPRKPFDLPVHARRSLRFFLPLLPLLPLLALSMFNALRKGLWRPWLAVLSAALASLIVGERFLDVPVQLPTALLIAPLIAFASDFSRWWLRLVTASASLVFIGGCAWNNLGAARGASATLMREQQGYLQMARASNNQLVLVNLRDFNRSRRFERVVFGATYNHSVLSPANFRRRCRALARGNAMIWFARGPYHSPCSQLSSSHETSTRTVAGRRYRVLVPRSVNP